MKKIKNHQLIKTGLLFFFILISFCFCTNGQDRIIMKRGDTLFVKLIEISTDTIRFKKSAELTGSDYLVGTNKVKKIIYQDGAEEVFIDKDKPIALTGRADFGKIKFKDLQPIHMEGSSAYYQNGVRLGGRDMLALFHTADSIETLHYYKKVILNKSLAISGCMIAIPASIVVVPAWSNYDKYKNPGEFGFAVLSTLVFAAMETGFVYYNIQAKKNLKKSIDRYNKIIAIDN